MRLRTWLVTIFAFLIASVPAVAREDFYVPNAALLPVSASVPLGFSLHCLMHPVDCEAGGVPLVFKTPQLMNQLTAVNRAVNASIIPTAGLESAVWQVDPTRGNCHDYALTKRQHLIELGLPPSALRLAYVKTERGDGHAVLIVETDRGELVLDNLTGLILPKSQTRLRFISASTANPREWVML